MKKIIALFITIIMVISMISCGEVVETPVNGTVSQVEEITIEDTASNVLTIDEPITVIDNENLTFSVKAVEYDSMWGTYSLKVFIENKTDKMLMVTWEDTSVNGYMCDPFWASEVAGGKKENTSISWFISSFEENDIDYHNITNIEFCLKVYHMNEETYDITYYADDVFVLDLN